ncbi:hypothetical protein ABFB09_04065 [Dehalogenimonas sp. THU2]|uniref:hypothetical protein n=1 Tax=Dehalogenimonas sp. THU2 TaxID=3151121 RepID=UPI003218363D
MKTLLIAALVIGLLVPATGCQRFERELAPIEGVSIELTESGDQFRAQVEITYGLPNGCYEPDEIKKTAITGGFDIAVWIKLPATAEACNEIYRLETAIVDLGSDFKAGETYTARVNGVEHRFTVSGATGDEDLIIKTAPIVSVDVRIAESFQPQVFIDIRGLLTDGCTVLNDVDIQRQGTTIDITVTTQRPKDAVCIQVVSFFTHAVPLGSDFVAGQTYTLRVNGQASQFTVGSSGGSSGGEVPPVTDPAPAPAPMPGVPPDR